MPIRTQTAQAIADHRLLSEEDRRRLLAHFNDTAKDYSLEQSLPRLCEEQAARTPDAEAVRFEEHSLTYRELNQRANRLAHRLRARGVGPETLVGICMERSLELVIGLLGILKAGGAYVPLDPDYPAERLAYMLGDAHVRVLLTMRPLVERLPIHGTHLICLDEDLPDRNSQCVGNPVSGVLPHNLAYMIYTSGSTGRPKGAMNTHRGICNRLAWMQDAYQLTASDCVLQKTPFSFDVSVWEFFWPLIVGARLVLARPGGHRDSAYLVDLIAACRVTTLHFVPSMFHAFLEEPNLDRCASLKRVICSGEALPVDLHDRFFARLPAELHNLYGPTEAAVDVTYWACRAGSETRTVPIGRPIANTQIFLLDQALQPVPLGEAADLYIGGVGLGRGYAGRPDLTAEKFIPHPFAAEPGERLYRTGDLARYRADGAIEFLGRTDHQVKIRGFRIELGEIEAVLGKHPAVREVTVMAREDRPGDTRLVAYVVAPGAGADATVLRGYAAERLPEHMVPGVIVPLDALPLMPNGKVDRATLPAPTYSGAAGEGPRTPLEELLAAIWCSVLTVERVGRDDSFFALGGHSLSAARVMARVREALGINPSLHLLFEQPTLARFARAVADAQEETGVEQAPALTALPREDPIPLSFAQQSLWLMDQFMPDAAVYTLGNALRLHGVLKVDLLQNALNGVIERHEALRTRFPLQEGRPVQRIDPPAPVPLPVVDLTMTEAGDRERQVNAQMRAEATLRFDLAQGPLFRARLLRQGSDEHLLLLTMHHSIGDGWSSGVLLHELATLYAALRTGAPNPLPPLPIQYADYTRWQRSWMQGAPRQRHLAYWRAQLLDVPTTPSHPTDYPRPAQQRFSGAVRPFHLSVSLTEELRALSRQEGVTLFMILLAAFQTLLARYSGQSDIVVGTPSANRGLAETEPLIGFFVNMLPLRTNLGGDPTFRELLARVREVCLGAYAHQDLPFAHLVAELAPARDPGLQPFFQVVLGLDNTRPHPPAVEGLQIEQTLVDNGTAKYDLTLLLEDTAHGVSGVLEYSTELYNDATIDRMLSHLEMLLKGAAEDPARHLSALPLLTGAEREQLLVTWNATNYPYPTQSCLHELFVEQVERSPHAAAATYEGERLTYLQLDAQANQLAHYLRAHGVGPDVPVGICMERSLHLVVALLGILKAGGAYVALDPSYPAERLSFMLEDTGAPILLTTTALRSRLPAVSTVMLLDRELPALTSLPTSSPISGATADNLAYISYTSGSTGRPKGVMITHRDVVRLVRPTTYVDLGSADVFLHLAPLAFDASTFELWGCFLNGARLVIFPSGPVELDNLARVLRREEVTILWLTAGLFHQMVEGHLPALTALRRILAGGDVLQESLVRRVVQGMGDGRLINGYGPTESTTFACCLGVRQEHLVGRGVPIGRPIGNTQLYVLDARLQPVPIGVIGDLYIGGDGLARGYLGRPSLTAERFIPDPFSAEPGARLYRTGDRVQYLADGNLEFRGRADQQIKLRGYRIELGEIEAALTMHPDVQDCTVLAREDTPGDKRLVAYFVAAAKIEAVDLRGFLRTHLPEYMTPPAYVQIERLPLTANGKVDRAALPNPERQDLAQHAGYAPPRTELERQLVAIWAEVLDVERLGIHDNFFELGGHSLSATTLAARVREQLKLPMTILNLFECPTPAELAAALATTQPCETEQHNPALLPVSRAEPLPLSYAQQRLWFLDQLSPNSVAYNTPLTARLRGVLDVAALERSLTALIQRHESLRTTFALRGEQPVQVIAPPHPCSLPLDDLIGVPPGNGEAEARRLAAAETTKPFNLERGPLFRARLLRLDERDHILLLTMHHIVSDGWSLSVLGNELSALYTAALGGETASLPPLPVQYADYAAWQRAALRGPALRELADYWRDQLAGAPAVLPLPTDKPRPALRTQAGEHMGLILPEAVSVGLRALGARRGVTLFMTLLAAFQVVLRDMTGEDDIVMGTSIAGRTRQELEGLIGFFVNTLVLRADLSANPSFIDLLERVRGMCLGAYAHQDLPFEQLVEHLQPVRRPGYTPLVQALFELHNTPETVLNLPGMETSRFDVGERTAAFDLTIALRETAQGLHCDVEYAVDLFEAETIGRLLDHYQRVLEAVVVDPSRTLAELPRYQEDLSDVGLVDLDQLFA